MVKVHSAEDGDATQCRVQLNVCVASRVQMDGGRIQLKQQMLRYVNLYRRYICN